MSDFATDAEAAAYGLGVLQTRHPEIDAYTPEAAKVVSEVVGQRSLAAMSRSELSGLTDEIADAWKAKYSLSSGLEAWQKSAGLL